MAMKRFLRSMIAGLILMLLIMQPAVCSAVLLTEEEAIRIAKEKYPQSARKMGLPLLDLNAYDTECGQIKNGDGTITWSVEFLTPEYDVPFVEVEAYVFEKTGKASIVWNDPDMFIHKYQIWRRRYGLNGFRAWPLDVQASFYQELLRVKAYHVEAYGPLEDMVEWQNYVRIISRVHDVPKDGEIQLEDALNLARKYLVQTGIAQNELQNLEEYVAFYRDEPDRPEYELRYFKSKVDEQPLYQVIVNAVTGEVKEEQK